MAYVTPTVSDFITRFPEYQNVSAALVGMVLNESISEVGGNWCDKDRANGQLYLTAHKLAVEGEPERSNAIANGSQVTGATTGAVVELKDRDVSVKFSDKGSNELSGNESEITKSFMKTPYGERYLLLLRRNVSTFFAV